MLIHDCGLVQLRTFLVGVDRAFEDQMVRIGTEDRAEGVLRGTRDAIDGTDCVRPQADGSVRVEFNTAGATSRDPDLINRIARLRPAYGKVGYW